MTNQQNTSVSTSTVELTDLDEFLPLPGAESILTPDEKKPSMFSKNEQVDMGFLDNEKPESTDSTEENAENEKKPTSSEAKSLLDDLMSDEDSEESEEGESKKTGRPRLDKSGMTETFNKLFEKGTLIPFDDGKKLEEYSVKDWEELIEANIQERERQVREQTPKEFFESLPDELQYAAKYVADGGSDLKGLFRALASVEEARQLDPSTDADAIARQYLRATQFGTEDEIAEQIQEWTDMNLLTKKATGFKPKLDRMQEEVIAAQLAQQEQMKQQREEAMKQYVENVYQTVRNGELNGIKLDKKTQAFLFTEMTQAKYESMSGKPVNLLGHLLEKYQYIEPRYDLISEAMWLLSNPEEYKEQIRQQAKNAATAETVRKLKTEEGRKIASTSLEEPEQVTPRKTLNRPTNIFKRAN